MDNERWNHLFYVMIGALSVSGYSAGIVRCTESKSDTVEENV